MRERPKASPIRPSGAVPKAAMCAGVHGAPRGQWVAENLPFGVLFTVRS